MIYSQNNTILMKITHYEYQLLFQINRGFFIFLIG